MTIAMCCWCCKFVTGHMADIFWNYLYLFVTVSFVIPNLSFMIFGSVVVFGAEGIDQDSNTCSYGPYIFAYISLIMRNYTGVPI